MPYTWSRASPSRSWRRSCSSCECGAVHSVLEEGAAGRTFPGDIDVAAGADGDRGALVVADTRRELQRLAERLATVGRAAEQDLVASVPVEIRPGGVDIAGHRINSECGPVGGLSFAERVRVQEH